MNRDQLEACIWHLLPTARPDIIAAILTAADAYATGDSDHVCELRRHVLHAMSAPIPAGTRR